MARKREFDENEALKKQWKYFGCMDMRRRL